jgi:gas vesicle protein
MSSSTNSLILYAAGIATGVSIGLLFAPEKGEITRDRLGYRLNHYRHQLEALINDFVERGDEVAAEIANGEDSQAKAEGRKVVNEARIKAEGLLKEVETLMFEIKAKKEA